MREHLHQVAVDAGVDAATTKVVISGLCNVYTHYITTFEEYQRQRYEAASTLFGPLTLLAHMNQYKFLVESLVSGTPVTSEFTPPNLKEDQITLLHEPDEDVVPEGATFLGECIQQPPETASVNQEVVVK